MGKHHSAWGSQRDWARERRIHSLLELRCTPSPALRHQRSMLLHLWILRLTLLVPGFQAFRLSPIHATGFLCSLPGWGQVVTSRRTLASIITQVTSILLYIYKLIDKFEQNIKQMI